jgi:hypothetical protein
LQQAFETHTSSKALAAADHFLFGFRITPAGFAVLGLSVRTNPESSRAVISKADKISLAPNGLRLYKISV